MKVYNFNLRLNEMFHNAEYIGIVAESLPQAITELMKQEGERVEFKGFEFLGFYDPYDTQASEAEQRKAWQGA